MPEIIAFCRRYPRSLADLLLLRNVMMGLSLVLLVTACGGEGPTPTATPLPAPIVTITVTAPVAATRPPPTSTPAVGALAARATPADMAATLPLLADHLAAVQAALQQDPPVLPLRAGLDDAQRRAQALALADAQFLADVRDPQSGAAYRNEIFGIYPIRAGDVTAALALCQSANCYRVEMYNYALNLSTIAIVELVGGTTVAVNTLHETQPDIPPHLMAIAVEIAIQAPETATAWGEKPAAQDAGMANVKSALNQSRCERSRHLCVAPTFVKGDAALWAIVDLTEGTLVGLRWTDVGHPGPPLTEKSLENDVVMNEFCDKVHTLARDGWRLDYVLTSSDGLRVSDVTFQERPVADSLKLVDWHVSYSRQEGFGYSDAIGCPVFSQASVVAFNGPHVEEIRAQDGALGFALIQEYRSETWPAPCNYNYSQSFEFYTDGRFRMRFGNHGRGCGNDGVYRPVLRIALAGAQSFAAWGGSAWVNWTTEGWQPPPEAATGTITGTVTAEGFQFRVLDEQGAGYYIEPARGQFGDGGRGDNPYLYVTRRHLETGANDEGETDLITIGPCCNNDYQQGPEKFIEPAPEALAGSPFVIWYVAQLKNDDAPGAEYCWAEAVLRAGVYVPQVYPCYGGPMFVPVE